MVAPLFNTTAVILSGGSGSDFNRKDKGWELWQGTPLIEHCTTSLQPQVSDIIICCNRHHERYQELGYRLCQDLRPVFQGPLAGVEAGLKACDTEYALLYPSDSAIAPPELASKLMTALRANNADVAYLKAFPISQYLIAVVKTELAKTVTTLLDNGGRSVQEWYEELNTVAVDCEFPADAIHNFNSPEELN